MSMIAKFMHSVISDNKRVYLRFIKNKLLFYFGNNTFNIQRENEVDYGINNRFQYCDIIVHGNNNRVIFGHNCNYVGLHILIEGDNNTIEFGNNVTINASKLQPTVINAFGGTKIQIGTGALLSNNIEIHSTDYHGIYDKNGKRINHDKDIVIGKHVWICLGCKVLKGSVISDGSVVGAGSVVSGHYEESNVILAGNPAMIKKRYIFWAGERMENYQVPGELQALWSEGD